MITRSAVPALLAFLVLAAGCNKPAVESYRVPKEPAAQTPDPHVHDHGVATAAAAGAAAPADGATMANTAVPTASGAGLAWTAPAHWQTKSTSAMRKGSYAISGNGGADADLAVTAFPGDVGGDFANLNRWRGQIQLPPISEAEFPTAVVRQERNGLAMTVVDIAGTGANAQRILGAMVPYGGATWFFKMQGPDAVVAKEKAAFMALLDTVKPAASTQ